MGVSGGVQRVGGVPSENDVTELFGPDRPHVDYRVVARGARDTGISGAACACWVDYNLLNYPYLRTHPALSRYAVFPHPGRRVGVRGLEVCGVRGEWMEGVRCAERDGCVVSPAVSFPLL